MAIKHASRFTMAILLLVLLATLFPLSCTSPGPTPTSTSLADTPTTPSVTCIKKLGLSGTITSDIVVGKLTDDGPDTAFVGTSDGLYVISNGTLQQYIYSPFGISHIALVEDATGDGVRDIVVSLTQADVPSIRCYNGATGEKVWESAPRQRVFVENMGWADIQLHTTDLKILQAVDSQTIIIATGRCLFSLSAASGRHLWTLEAKENTSDTYGEMGLLNIATVSDMDGDGTQEVVVGSAGGFLYLISGEKGTVLWKKRIAERYFDNIANEDRQAAMREVKTLDAEACKVVAISDEGKVRLIDLQQKSIEWEVSVKATELPASLYLCVTSDLSGDGLAEILMGVAISSSRAVGYDEIPQAKVTLLNAADGNGIWERELYLWPYTGLHIGIYDSQPVVLEPHRASGVRMRSLGTGDTLNTMSTQTLQGEMPRVKQLASDQYLVVSDSSDLIALSGAKSSLGGYLWHYPRAVDTEVEEATFNSNTTQDLLVWCKSTQPTDKRDTVRLLCVLDGATHKELWRYEVPYSDFTALGGLSGLQVTPDLTGDGLQDTVGYRGSSIFLFNGGNGSMTQLSMDKDITQLQSIKVGTNTTALLVSTEDGMAILDGAGTELYRSTYADWGNIATGSVQALEDLNEDSTSDLAIIFSDRIIIAKSTTPRPLGYEPLRSIMATGMKSIEFKEITPDIDGDGVKEIAYFEFESVTFNAQKETPSTIDGSITIDDEPSTPAYKGKVLLVTSPTSSQILLQLDQTMQSALSLACADFNGDGFADSLVCWGDQETKGPELQVISGKDGTNLWSYQFSSSDEGSRYPLKELNDLPATSSGDVDSDGIEDLAISELDNSRQARILVYSISRNALLRSCRDTEIGFTQDRSYAPGNALQSVGDVDGDGHKDLAISIVSGYGHNLIGTICPESQALVSPYEGKLLASFVGPGSGLFHPQRDHMLGRAADGGVYLLSTVDAVRVTSPSTGSTIASPAKITWEDTRTSSFNEVIIDGISNAWTNDTNVQLSLTHGEHELTVCCIDEYGKISYSTATFQVRQLPGATLAAAVLLLGLLLLYFHARWNRARRNRRAQGGDGPCVS